MRGLNGCRGRMWKGMDGGKKIRGIEFSVVEERGGEGRGDGG